MEALIVWAAERGRMLPAGLRYVESWVDERLDPARRRRLARVAAEAGGVVVDDARAVGAEAIEEVAALQQEFMRRQLASGH